MPEPGQAWSRLFLENRASDDPEQFKRWGAKNPRSNIGIATGDVSGIVVLDIDGAEGQASLDALTVEHGPLPATITVRTGSGGHHYYFKYPVGENVSNTASTIAPKIDTRANGGFVVAPPSNHKSGGAYEFLAGCSPDDLEPAEMPEWMLALATKKTTGVKERVPTGPGTQSPRGNGTATPDGTGLEVYLSQIGDGEGRHGFDSPIYQAACSYFGVNGADADPALIKDKLTAAIQAAPEDPTKPRKDSKYLTDDYLDRRIAQASEFIAVSPRDSSEQVIFNDPSLLVDQINKDFALICVGSKVVYLHQRGSEFDLMNKQSCADLLAPYKLMINTKRVAGFGVWLESPERRRFDGVVFDPDSTRDRYFNLWKGLAVSPYKGDWSRFRDHLIQVICGNDPESAEWLFGWMAQMVQQPGSKPGTAVVLRGEKGTGKTTLAIWLKAILGDHAVTVDKPSLLVGRFNAHLERCVLLNAEEGFWAGDREAEGALKNLITSKEMMLERKGVDAVTVANHVRLLVTSNADWVVPATQDERRFFVLDVSNEHKKDSAWFGAIDDEFRNGGVAAFLHDLLGFDYSHLDLRNPPPTSALVEQMAETFLPKLAWWHSVLKNGEFEDARMIGDSAVAAVNFSEWSEKSFEIEKAIVHDNFNQYVAGVRGRPWVPALIGKFLKELMPDLEITRKTSGTDRPWCYLFPPLFELRKRFTAKYHLPFGNVGLNGPNPFMDAAREMLLPGLIESIVGPKD